MSAAPDETEKGSFFTARNILAIVIAVVALVFVFSNVGRATLNIFGARLTMPGWVWFFLLLVVGFVVGSLFPWFRTGKKKR